MTPITGPATLLRRVAKILATARRGRRPLRPPAAIDGDRLLAYWEGTLDAEARREVESQASTCGEYRRWLEEIGKLFSTDVSTPPIPAEPTPGASKDAEEEHGMKAGVATSPASALVTKR